MAAPVVTTATTTGNIHIHDLAKFAVLQTWPWIASIQWFGEVEWCFNLDVT